MLPSLSKRSKQFNMLRNEKKLVKCSYLRSDWFIASAPVQSLIPKLFFHPFHILFIFISVSVLILNSMHRNKITTLSALLIINCGHKSIVAPFMAPALDHRTVNSRLSQPWALIRHCWAQFYSEGAVMKHWVGVVVLYIAACVGQLFNQSL